MTTTSLRPHLAALAISAISLVVKADLAVYCTNSNDGSETATDGSALGFGAPDMYQTCTDCSCSTFELLCLKANGGGSYTLSSESFANSQADSSLVCNYSTNWASISTIVTGDSALPDPYQIALPAFSLIESLYTGGSATQYVQAIYEELTEAVSRAQTPVNHEINGEVTGLSVSQTVSSIATGCTSADQTISCDVYYETDWNHWLQTSTTCGSLATAQPCFATQACLCENEYYNVHGSMPVLSSPYYGRYTTTFTNYFNEVQSAV